MRFATLLTLAIVAFSAQAAKPESTGKPDKTPKATKNKKGKNLYKAECNINMVDDTSEDFAATITFKQRELNRSRLHKFSKYRGSFFNLDSESIYDVAIVDDDLADCAGTSLFDFGGA